MSTAPDPVLTSLARGLLRRHPEEAARVLERLPVEEAVRLLRNEPAAEAAAVLEQLTADAGAHVVLAADDEFSRLALARIDPARAAEILSRMEKEDSERRLGLLEAAAAKLIRSIMTYPADSAGHLMDPRVMTFRQDTTVETVLLRLRTSGRRQVREVFVVDAEERLAGSIPIQEIATAPPEQRTGELVRERPASVRATATREEVIELMGQRKLFSLPVVDFEGRLLGLIRQEALMAAVQEEASADLQAMVGASREERSLSKVSFAVKKRLPWLHINLATAFLAAAVVGLFEDTIARFTALAVLLPVVAGQSGNTGAQALAVTMRGLALREVRVYQWLRVFVKELNVALVNGVAVAATTSAAVWFWSGSQGLSLVIGISMVISMVAAGMSGVVIPMALTAVGQDPAQSSSIILTTITDVVGFFSFLGIATLLSSMI